LWMDYHSNKTPPFACICVEKQMHLHIWHERETAAIRCGYAACRASSHLAVTCGWPVAISVSSSSWISHSSDVDMMHVDYTWKSWNHGLIDWDIWIDRLTGGNNATL
jgi:hypothetical protein